MRPNLFHPAEGVRLRLAFEPALETRYRQLRAGAIRERSRPASMAALLLFVMYAGLDLAMLPPELAQSTIAIRLGVAAPVIVAIYWLSFRNPPSDGTFERLYALAYLLGGLSVVAIIARARMAHYPLPYEGILLILMFGYFAMGVPFALASLTSALIIMAYAITELLTGFPLSQLALNLFFILSVNAVGMIGAWLAEYRHRAHFLDQQQLQELHVRSEQESRRKSHLIAVASHDLRQPLNAISLSLENLALAPLPDAQHQQVTRLQHAVRLFNRLLGSVLDISRINEGMISPATERLAADLVLEDAAASVAEAARSQNIQLHCRIAETPPGVRADPQLLQRILQNLITNALDHSGGRNVYLSVEADAGHARFEVRDDGRGLPAGLGHSVFERYTRGPETRAQASGLGLGLAIVRELCELMGGSCGVDSSRGKGSRFWVRLPAVTRPAPGATPIETSPQLAEPGLRILVLEDHEHSRTALQQTLHSWGYAAEAVATPEQALTRCRTQPFDLLISDLNLVEMSGLELADRLHQQRLIQRAIIITADTHQPEGHYGPHCQLLHKPLHPLRLRSLLLQPHAFMTAVTATPGGVPG